MSDEYPKTPDLRQPLVHRNPSMTVRPITPPAPRPMTKTTKLKLWWEVYVAVSHNSSCKSSEVAARWADKAVEEYLKLERTT